MASGPITSWQIDGETVETVPNFIFLGSKITADGDCSQEIKGHLLWRKIMTNLDSILKSRDITLLTKISIVRAVVFSTHGYDSWIIKKAEHQRIAAFKLWCWRRLLRVSWTARRSDQPILKKSTLNIHWKDWCWNWGPNVWPPDAKSWLIGKNPDAGKDRRQEEKGMTEDEMIGCH